MPTYIHNRKNYPKFTWDSAKITDILVRVATLQGSVLGKMKQFGFGIQQQAMLNALTEEITKSSEIEGEILNSEQVRSSLARRLNIHLENPATESHHIDGVVQAMVDAVDNYSRPLTNARLFGWHSALFSTGYSGIHKILVGKYRKEEMQVVSTKGYRDIVHYEAPLPNAVPKQMKEFLDWLNKDGNENPLLKAAIAHLWFVIIHPFDDGNGRLTRTITEMMLAKAENTNLRFYSMSAQIQKEKKGYYAVLERTTTGDTDITAWLVWFFGCLERAIQGSSEIVGAVLKKAEFWHKNAIKIPDPRQQEIMNKLFDGWIGNLTSGKVAQFLKTSPATAIRLLQDLTDKGFLVMVGSGRTTHYELPQNK
ncbi:cell division protein Fic [Endomicrobiia bacterium]|nr:cell division protein Fic [Endomicrobiia bacterium]